MERSVMFDVAIPWRNGRGATRKDFPRDCDVVLRLCRSPPRNDMSKYEFKYCHCILERTR